MREPKFATTIMKKPATGPGMREKLNPVSQQDRLNQCLAWNDNVLKPAVKAIVNFELQRDPDELDLPED